MCILNFSEKRNLRKKTPLSWAVLILVWGFLCAFVFSFCALIIIKGLLYKETIWWVFTFHSHDFKAKKKIQSLLRRLSCLWLWWHFCTFKKIYFVDFFLHRIQQWKQELVSMFRPSSDSEVFVCWPFDRPGSNVTSWNPTHMQLWFVAVNPLQFVWIFANLRNIYYVMTAICISVLVWLRSVAFMWTHRYS